jgi:hypothetical protein
MQRVLLSRQRRIVTRFYRRPTFLVPLLVGAAVTVLTIWLNQREDWLHEMFRPLLSPGVIGYILAGGVHGGASAETLDLVWGVGNGLVWAAASLIVVQAVRTIIRMSRSRRLPLNSPERR